MWGPTFQMAWDSFNDEIIKGKIRLNKAQTLADILNGSPYKTDNLTPESFFAKSAVIDVDHSLKPDLIKEFIAKLGEQGNEDVLNDCREMVDKASPLPGFLAFAYLEKFLAFSTPFYVFKTPLRFSDGNSKTLTESFGISVYDCENNGKRNKITVGDYVDPDNFILILDANSIGRKLWEEVKKTTPGNVSVPENTEVEVEDFEDLPPGSDEIILAKMPPRKTLEECWELVKTRIKNSKGEGGLGENEKVQIPKVHIDQRRKYEELHGAGLLNPGFEQYFIADTLQVVKFDLNEKGAELRSYAMVIYAGASGIPYIAPPRSFILDKPFLMILRQKGKEPYLMCWIANSELLKKWEPDDKFVDFFEKGKADALSDISAKNNFYMVDKCGNGEKPETTEDLRQLIMKRDFGFKSKSPEDILKGDFRDDYIQGYNEIALGAVEKKMSVKLPKELEKRTKVECKKIHMLNLPTVSILLSLFNLQNPDGSWGNSDKTRIILTSLGTLALLGHGENVESEFFGKTFKKSLAYLTQNSEKRFQEFTPAEKAMVTLDLLGVSPSAQANL